MDLIKLRNVCTPRMVVQLSYEIFSYKHSSVNYSFHIAFAESQNLYSIDFVNRGRR